MQIFSNNFISPTLRRYFFKVANPVYFIIIGDEVYSGGYVQIRLSANDDDKTYIFKSKLDESVLSSSCVSLPFPDEARYEELAGSVGGPDERPAGGVQEAELAAACLPLFELGWSHVLEHFQVTFGRLHVLTQG